MEVIAHLKDYSYLIGKQFGQWTVLDVMKTNDTKHGAFAVCKCECGTVKQVRAFNLMNGRSTSCGKHRKHGDSKKGQYHRLYQIWADMKNRCSSPTCSAYIHYGGRGITVFPEWNDYLPFKEWALNNGYDKTLTIDRIDVNGNYCPDNCRWATYSVQNANQTNTPRYTYNEETHSLREWSSILGISVKTLRNRIYHLKWPIDRALSEEVKCCGKHVGA